MSETLHFRRTLKSADMAIPKAVKLIISVIPCNIHMIEVIIVTDPLSGRVRILLLTLAVFGQPPGDDRGYERDNCGGQVGQAYYNLNRSHLLSMFI